ncbi:uncharacterized protein LOC116348505 isoform X2 [Contarinia nasturtii]|uniref:uncharacterized protein LOC116348505 isoform X2 n=1 Tax=Contarinia nasturtii TaxID=265458 RepID=UPI0012D3FA36|nr:uncharacterized protein LOC116348505 isoform X2 [Contarinia nasturtii]
MNQEQNADQSGPSAKKMKSNDEDNNPAERAVVAVNGEQQLADIFKLNIDCFEEVFDYLSLKDFTAMGQTCKRMQRIAGHCFQLNYGAEQAEFWKDGVFFDGVRIDCFNNFLQNVYLTNYGDDEDGEDEFDNSGVENATHNHMIGFVTELKQSRSIKSFEINGRLTMDWINEMQVLLSKAESVKIYGYDENENELDALTTACSNITYLSLDGQLSQVNEYKWMHRIYQALEHFELDLKSSQETPALITFFELNTTIKQFSVDAKLLWQNRELFKNSNIKFDTLEIIHERNVDFHLFCRLLNELYEFGFYKKLYFDDSFGTNQGTIDQLATVKGLVKFQAAFKMFSAKVGALRNLEEASSDDILPFICHAEKVNKIKVEQLCSGSHFDQIDKILDLMTLNKKREKLVGARKIMIYVSEDVYLATKWAMKQTDFKLIEMKRITSYDWKY